LKLGLHQSARLEQRLLQSPQMIQAMQILQMSAPALEERIEQELTENPLLELVEPGEEGGAELEKRLDELEQVRRDLFDRPGVAKSSGGDDEDAKQLALANAPLRARSLSETLVEQLGLLELSPRQRALGEQLVWSLDARGFLTEELEDVALASGLEGAHAEELRPILEQLRATLHPGIGARDLVECLLLQARALCGEDALMEALITRHLEDITHNRLPRIAKQTGATLEEIQQAIEIIRGLDPNPGREYGDSTATAITPDVVVEEEDGEYHVRLTRTHVPRLRLSSAYRHLLRRGAGKPEVQQWIKKRMDTARWFLDALAQRESTLERIAKSIFARQQGFLERGVRGLVPLRMQEVADEAHVHISTVSRAVAGKYAQTPRGILPLKFFFTSGTVKESGEVESQNSIKSRIAELVEREDPKHPLSDDQIAELLEKDGGVKIARRTVTKYRKALAIPASTQRKKF